MLVPDWGCWSEEKLIPVGDVGSGLGMCDALPSVNETGRLNYY